MKGKGGIEEKRKKREEGMRASLPNTAQAGKGTQGRERMPLSACALGGTTLKKQSAGHYFENRIRSHPMELQVASTGKCDWLSPRNFI